jgi:hypothetical protein
VPAPVDETITLEGNLVANGSTLFSLPLDPGSLDVGGWLLAAGLSVKGIHGWDAQTQGYVPLKTIRPGEGFLLARGPGKVSVSGKKLAAESVDLTLRKGWNLIGVPYETGIVLATVRITLEGKTEGYLSAVEKKLVGAVNALVDGRLTPLDASARLEPWHGYWFYAYQSCLLNIPSGQVVPKVKPVKGKSPRKR